LLVFHIWSKVGDAPAAALPTFDQMRNTANAEHLVDRAIPMELAGSLSTAQAHRRGAAP